jgi:hypothetical protein
MSIVVVNEKVHTEENGMEPEAEDEVMQTLTESTEVILEKLPRPVADLNCKMAR